ncbi:hypothetical protein [Arthrobacter livingstonensis]|uniref:hypothetical protein n=1 Tax=Arthrobacter livingstonensis TaxID=670078 RepID=UPI0011B60BF4|nr:hypothetical protein [Arthrobacter livingstonensis]
MAPTDHEGIARALREHPAKKGVAFNIAVTVLEVGGGIGLFHLAKGISGNDVTAYVSGSIAPLLGAVVVWARSRKFSGASAAMFAFVVLSAVVAAVVGRTDPKVLLYKDCAITALVGLVFGLSCILMPRPWCSISPSATVRTGPVKVCPRSTTLLWFKSRGFEVF